MSIRAHRSVVSRSLLGAALAAGVRGGARALGVAVVVGVVGGGVVVPHAVAQSNRDWHFGGFNVSDDMMSWGFSSPRPPFTRTMLRRAFDRLEMDPDQREVAQSVYDSFEQEYLSLWLQQTERSSDERMAQMMTQDWEAMQEQSERRQTDFKKQMKQLLDAFMLDFELMLNAEQTKIWEQIELDRKRGEHLALAADGRYRPVDLALVIDGLKMDESTKASLMPIIESYHRDIDAALVPALRQADRVVSLGQEWQAVQRRTMAMHREEQIDHQAIQRMHEEQVSKGEATRDAALDLRRMYGNVLSVHRRAVEELQRALPSQYHEAFEKATVQRASSQGFDWSGYSRFNIAAQTLENLEQSRAMMDMQLAMMTDSMDEEQSAMFREMALMMRRARPLTTEQKRELERIRDEHKRKLEDLEATARRRMAEAREAAESNMIEVRVPGGSVTLYRMDAEGNVIGWRHRNQDDNQQETQRKRSQIDQAAINDLRAMLDFYQRAIIANF